MKFDKYFHLYAKKAEFVFEEVKPEVRWTLCKDTTDIPEDRVLAIDKDEEISIGYLGKEGDLWFCEDLLTGKLWYQVAWMPLPPKSLSPVCLHNFKSEHFIDRINKWLAPEIDPEIALEKIREIVYEGENND